MQLKVGVLDWCVLCCTCVASFGVIISGYIRIQVSIEGKSMGRKNTRAVILFVILVFAGYCCEIRVSTTVTYDGKALVIDGKRQILQSGSIHYPRTTPEVS